MLNTAFFKRIAPFVITFALGLFVASFFVSITPNFQFRKKRCCRKSDVQRLQYENQRLQLENQRLQERLNEKMILLEEPLPPPPPSAFEMPADAIPAHPVAPRAK